ncbi:MAG: type VI secretion system baseplate subunit TssG [Betaproteobacteria bacterium]
MSQFPGAPPPADEDDPEGTRILSVSDVLSAMSARQGDVASSSAAVAEILAQKEQADVARHEARQELLRQLTEAPHKFGFFQAVRMLENAHPGLPRIGTSLRLRDDPIRFGQSPSLSFAPATLARFTPGEGGAPPTLRQRFFGLFGANGPLPLHLTEFARERSRRTPSDRALVRFLDMFHHRLLSLFYRAWAEASPTVSMDRPDNDPFSRWVASVAGYGQPSLSGRDSIPDGARLAAAGILGRSVHGAEGLERILNDFFRVPVAVHQWQPHWMRLPEEARSRIGLRNAPVALGENAVVGAQVWDCQTRFRIEIGPLTLAEYERFLPGGESMQRLHDWVLNFIGYELSCEMHLVLKTTEVPAVKLGQAGALGWTSWLGPRRQSTDASDLVLGIT